MIRRAKPLDDAVAPQRWLLIAQPDHARLSQELARVWGGQSVSPLVCGPDGSDPLAQVRAELLEAVRCHDDGWIGYQPLKDPPTGRPLNFTEMPADAAQAIWDKSIEACRKIGPLAGWLVASHFHALQAKQDDDYSLWESWLADVESQREAWLDEWLAMSALRTRPLAERCLAWLQAFDWASLWLCCVCPVARDDAMAEPLVLGSEATGWPTIRFVPTPGADAEGVRRITAAPWPFATQAVELRVAARSIPVDAAEPAETISLAWRIEPQR